MNKGLKALEKIDHTVCMNNLENNIKWDIDKYDHCACVSVEDFVECYETIEKELKALEIIKDRCELKVYKNKLGQCFLEGTNILFPISQKIYDLLKEVLL